jgi:uncharacterized protein
MKPVVVLIALLLLVWLLVGSARRRRRADRHTGAPARAPVPGPGGPIETMVACAHCGVHLPASQALQLEGRVYCSAAHRSVGTGAA